MSDGSNSYNDKLFQLSLERLQHSDWSVFERLCADFLVEEYPSLRTMANASGDGGRDSELYSPEGESTVAFQYSVTADWKPKIRFTISRIEATHPTVKYLIYLTNQLIGAQADKFKVEQSRKGIYLGKH